MGGSESVVRNVDKRTSRREHRPIFEAAILRFREAPFSAPEGPEEAGAGGGAAASTARSVRVCVRKRPFFDHERQQGEFDVVSCLERRVVIHDARMKPDMRHMFMNHTDFVFDEVFGELSGNEEVYTATARDLVFAVAHGASSGTVMCYGQTGSGKTFTMSSMYERVASEVFAQAGGSRYVSVCFVELLGDNCFDMLNAGAPCNLATGADGSVHPYPCVEVAVSNAAELKALVDMAAKLRATAATGVHDGSSRSHACCRIFVSGDNGHEACLTLVDLAGTEHRIDSAEHNAERQKEGAKINASLAALKECIRATAAGAKFVPFRRNRLTQLLRGCFAGEQAHPTVIIATVSPSSKDTEHSLNTLRHACIMDGQGESKANQSAALGGGKVTTEALGEIDVTRLARERIAARRKSVGMEKGPEEWGKPPPAHQSKQSNTARRSVLDRRCLSKLPPHIAEAIAVARANPGSDRQRSRFKAAPADAEEGAEGAAFEAPIPAARFSPSPRTSSGGGRAPAAAESAASPAPAAASAGGRRVEDVRRASAQVVDWSDFDVNAGQPTYSSAADAVGAALPPLPLGGLSPREAASASSPRGMLSPTLAARIAEPQVGALVESWTKSTRAGSKVGDPIAVRAGARRRRNRCAGDGCAATAISSQGDLMAIPGRAEALAAPPRKPGSADGGSAERDTTPRNRRWGARRDVTPPRGESADGGGTRASTPGRGRSAGGASGGGGSTPVAASAGSMGGRSPRSAAGAPSPAAAARKSAVSPDAPPVPLWARGARPEEASASALEERDTEEAKAMELFRLFCSGGRGAWDWRKNDLRLINTCVVPKLFGERARIDWAHPSAALDELERLVARSAAGGGAAGGVGANRRATGGGVDGGEPRLTRAVTYAAGDDVALPLGSRRVDAVEASSPLDRSAHRRESGSTPGRFEEDRPITPRAGTCAWSPEVWPADAWPTEGSMRPPPKTAAPAGPGDGGGGGASALASPPSEGDAAARELTPKRRWGASQARRDAPPGDATPGRRQLSSPAVAPRSIGASPATSPSPPPEESSAGPSSGTGAPLGLARAASMRLAGHSASQVAEQGTAVASSQSPAPPSSAHQPAARASPAAEVGGARLSSTSPSRGLFRCCPGARTSRGGGRTSDEDDVAGHSTVEPPSEVQAGEPLDAVESPLHQAQPAALPPAAAVAVPPASQPPLAVSDRGSLLRGEPEDKSPSPSPGPELVMSQAHLEDYQKALSLFRMFCCGGREACEWQKSDLRLINVYIVPELFGSRSRIDWAHPNVALDELERLIFENPMPAHFWHTGQEEGTSPPPTEEAKRAQPGMARSGSLRTPGALVGAAKANGKKAPPPRGSIASMRQGGSAVAAAKVPPRAPAATSASEESQSPPSKTAVRGTGAAGAAGRSPKPAVAARSPLSQSRSRSTSALAAGVAPSAPPMHGGGASASVAAPTRGGVGGGSSASVELGSPPAWAQAYDDDAYAACQQPAARRHRSFAEVEDDQFANAERKACVDGSYFAGPQPGGRKHKSFAEVEDEQIANLERKVSHKDMGIKQWLSSLRAELDKDSAAD